MLNQSAKLRSTALFWFVWLILILVWVSETSGYSSKHLVYLPMIVVPEGPITLVSVDSDGVQANRVSGSPSVSADGRYVAFSSDATNLVANDTNNLRDIFVHDRQTLQTNRVSIALGGEEANNESNDPFISADGRYVVFQSNASNLIPNDTNNMEDVFVYDQHTGQITRISVTATGVQANGASYSGSISADGRYVAFGSRANNLVAGQDLFLDPDIFVYDRQTGQTQRLTQDGANGISASYEPLIAANGRYVAFYSGIRDLVPDDTNNVFDVFVYDLQTDEISRVSVSSSGMEADIHSSLHSISQDGRYVTFESHATNLVPNDTNNNADIFVHDRQTRATIRVSVTSAGLQIIGGMGMSSISGDGRYVVFSSVDGNIVPGDTNNDSDVFLRDINMGVTTLISAANSGGIGNSVSYDAAISADGHYVVFSSEADNLVSTDTNFARDIFIRDR